MYTRYKKAPQVLCDVHQTRADAMLHNADGLSGRGLVTSLGEGKDRLFDKNNGKLGTAQALWVISTLAAQR